MQCPYSECASHRDCGILDITKKIPKSKDKCSYFRKEERSTTKQTESQENLKNGE